MAIFSLSLMGKNYLDYLKEARRVLKSLGELWIAEVKSRINNTKDFTQQLQNIGFQVLKVVRVFFNTASMT